jgi:corrinoid protein of di/trimethylamine methyltransferase
MNQQDIFNSIHNAIQRYDENKLVAQVEKALDEKVDPIKLIEDVMTPAMVEMGKKFQEEIIYLPELMLAAKAFKAAMKVIQPILVELRVDVQTKGKVVIGTVKGDLHDIGKNLVVTMFQTTGYDVLDLGIDVDSHTFTEEALKFDAQIIGLSALLTTTMAAQGEVIETLKEKGVRDKFKVIVGGAPINQGWADTIGADGYAENAPGAVSLVKNLLKIL